MKNSVKRENIYNMYVLNALKERYGFSYDYMRKSLRGDRTSVMSQKIKNDYKRLTLRLDSVIEKYKKE